MKYLQDYTQEAQSELFRELGVFFAFNRDQFDNGVAENRSKKPEGTNWANLGAGMFMPSSNVSEFERRHSEVVKEGIKRDLSENGHEAVILRELYNYECFYSGEIQPAVEALEGYGVSADEVLSVYRSARASENA